MENVEYIIEYKGADGKLRYSAPFKDLLCAQFVQVLMLHKSTIRRVYTRVVMPDTVDQLLDMIGKGV